MSPICHLALLIIKICTDQCDFLAMEPIFCSIFLICSLFQRSRGSIIQLELENKSSILQLDDSVNSTPTGLRLRGYLEAQ